MKIMPINRAKIHITATLIPQGSMDSVCSQGEKPETKRKAEGFLELGKD